MRGYGHLVRERLTQHGYWFVRRGWGDHDVWASLEAETPFTVPVVIDSRHTANKILKDAGLPKAF